MERRALQVFILHVDVGTGVNQGVERDELAGLGRQVQRADAGVGNPLPVAAGSKQIHGGGAVAFHESEVERRVAAQARRRLHRGAGVQQDLDGGDVIA